MPHLNIELSRDGHKNVVYIISGKKLPNGASIQVTDKEVMKPKAPTGLRLDAVEFSVEQGTKCLLTWGNENYILPIEGRGKLDFGWFDGIQGDDVHLTATGDGAVFIVLDMSKMGV